MQILKIQTLPHLKKSLSTHLYSQKMLSSLYFLYLSLHTNFLKFTLYLFIRTWTTCLLSFGSKYGADLNYTLHRSGPKKSCRVYFFSSDKSTDLICLVAIDNTTWYLQFHFVCAKLFVTLFCSGILMSS